MRHQVWNVCLLLIGFIGLAASESALAGTVAATIRGPRLVMEGDITPSVIEVTREHISPSPLQSSF